MPSHHLPINPTSFELIKQGHKQVETRLGNDPVLAVIRPDDQITFTNRDTAEEITKDVVAVRRFTSSAEVVESVGLKQLGEYDSPADYLDRMRSFQSDEDEAEHGIIAVTFR